VVADVDERLVFVASQALGGARRAKIVARSLPPPTENDLRVDLAVLELQPAPTHPPFKLGPTPPQPATPYLAGYPGFLLQRDAQFQEFFKGLAHNLERAENLEEALAQPLRVPGADLRSGRINNLMKSGPDSLPMLVHDMQLAPGNSGGPVV